MSGVGDPRLTPARPDLAAERLRGIVAAARYVAGEPRRVVAPFAPLRRRPSPECGIDTEALRGDAVTVYDLDAEGWAWGELARDGYVGYLPADALGRAGAAPTHRVHALRTFTYPTADMKTPPMAELSLGAAVTVVGAAETRGLAYALLDDGTAVVARHLAAVGEVTPDWIATAERLLGTPYLWGGTTARGVDCSGLVQLSLRLAGIAAPRDTDMQEAGLGTAVDLTAAMADPRRGDLLFWPGHVAIRAGGGRMLHASGFHMAVVIEEEAAALARIAAAGALLRTVRRI